MQTNINYHKLVNLLLPIRLRAKETLTAFLHVMLYPIREYLYPLFKRFEKKAWYDLKYQTGQVAYLEFVLNERFDELQTRIYISEADDYDTILWLYRDDEDLPLWLYKDIEAKPLWLFTEAESYLGGDGVDFIVNVPLGLPFEELAIRAMIDRYKRDGKSYLIKYFI